MFSRFLERSAARPVSAPVPEPEVPSYLTRLYLESRAVLFRIILGDDIGSSPSLDPTRTAETLQRIEGLLANDEHLNGCRPTLGRYFPGRLAVLFNLASEDDVLYPVERLRESILNHIKRQHAGFSGEPLEADDRKALEQLKSSSRLQQQLAYLVGYTPGKWLIEQEIPVVLESRRRRLHGRGDAAADVQFTPGEDAYFWSRDKGRFSGLCFSGGGIRSATFNLGVLQGLAKRDLIRHFDYLSSVSGGGYIHEWLAAWIKREEEQQPGDPGSPGLDSVCHKLIPQTDPGGSRIPAEPIRWLRRYSNYLTPQTGLFSADFWVTVAIWLRNTILNQIVLVAALVSLLMLPHVFLLHRIASGLPTISQRGLQAANWDSWPMAIAALILALLLASYLRVIARLATALVAARRRSSSNPRLTEEQLGWDIVLPSMVIAVVASGFDFWFSVPGLNRSEQLIALCGASFLSLLLLNIVITWAAGATGTRSLTARKFTLQIGVGYLAAAALAALVGTGALLLERNAFVTGSPVGLELPSLRAVAVSPAKTSGAAGAIRSQGAAVRHFWIRVHPEPDMQWRRVIVLGPFAVITVPFISLIFLCGLIGQDFENWVLEWLARVRAWYVLYSLLWVGAVGVALFGHDLVVLLASMTVWIKWPTVAVWLLTTVGSVLAGKSSKTGGDEQSGLSRWLKILMVLGPPTYILGLLLILSWCIDEGVALVESLTVSLPLPWQYGVFIAAVLLPFAVMLLFGWRVDINQFSMHTYYRNRLARCYLGASNTVRNPDPLTGFDPADVQSLCLSRFQPRYGYTGPLPVFCASLNISAGEDLAWQERKAASFAFSPVLCGYYVPWTGLRMHGQLSYNGFVPTERYADAGGGINISTAAAISGAAVSPNAGYHTSPAMAFLLTMFNVRLGWWIENPRRSWLAFDPSGKPPAKGACHGPRFAPAQLAQELLGRAGDARKFVYLSDGGHFENMGLYEMVRRRCYQIVICDAEQDSGPVFEGIGMAIRKCRIDFGAEISLDISRMACEAQSRISKAHWITGTIRYPETSSDPALEGTILYIKSSITGDEAGDLYNYRLQHTDFPQDSTADQWFSESQFESYRRLGQEVVDKCPYLERFRFGDVTALPPAAIPAANSPVIDEEHNSVSSVIVSAGAGNSTASLLL